MNKNDLLLKLRLDFNNKIRNDYIKEECEICKSTKNLHLHHIISFKEQFDQILKLMNLSYEHDFTDNEVELIRLSLLGLQCKNNIYMTLCENCHIKKHQKNKLSKKTEYKKYIDGVLKLAIPNEYLNTWITSEEIYSLIKLTNIKDRDGDYIGKRAFKQIIKNNGYNIKNKRSTKKGKKNTYYFIYKI